MNLELTPKRQLFKVNTPGCYLGVTCCDMINGGISISCIFAGTVVKFIYSEKATNLWEISTVDLSNVVTVKSTVEILQNFLAFTEYMNFMYIVRIPTTKPRFCILPFYALWRFVNITKSSFFPTYLFLDRLRHFCYTIDWRGPWREKTMDVNVNVTCHKGNQLRAKSY